MTLTWSMVGMVCDSSAAFFKSRTSICKFSVAMSSLSDPAMAEAKGLEMDNTSWLRK